jgi:hypothetical protein
MSDVSAVAPATEQTGSAPTADSIAAMIAANRRNTPQPDGSQPPPAGTTGNSPAPEAAPEEEAEPEDSNATTEEPTDDSENSESTDGVNEGVNFLEFAEQNPDMLLRIPNKDAEGGFVELTASKAAAILGQGSAIHENARKLKAEKAEFEELTASRINQLDGLQIGLELTVVPQLQSAADELITLQQYNQQWEQIRNQATDEIERSRAEAAIRQNAQLIEEKAGFIKSNRPKVEQFFAIRSQYVQEQLEQARQSFSDKELSNKVHFEELREKLAKNWKGANGSYVPGVKNIDLLSSDEHILGLIRDGMKFREGPKVKNAGGSLAASNRPVSKAKTSPTPASQQLQERANKGDKKAAQDLLAAMLAANKNRRR